jgi:hypothetical protein
VILEYEITQETIGVCSVGVPPIEKIWKRKTDFWDKIHQKQPKFDQKYFDNEEISLLDESNRLKDVHPITVMIHQDEKHHRKGDHGRASVTEKR